MVNLFLDCDIILLNKMDLLIDNECNRWFIIIFLEESEKMFGKYNAFVYINNKNILSYY